MALTIKLDGNWNSFQLANSAPPLSVTDSAIAPSARMVVQGLLIYDMQLIGSKLVASWKVSDHNLGARASTWGLRLWSDAVPNCVGVQL